jgi:hypothetical protein
MFGRMTDREAQKTVPLAALFAALLAVSLCGLGMI